MRRWTAHNEHKVPAAPPHTSSRTWAVRTQGGKQPGKRGHRIAIGIGGGTAATYQTQRQIGK